METRRSTGVTLPSTPCGEIQLRAIATGECRAQKETLGSIVERTKPAFEVAAIRVSRKHVFHESGMEGHNKALQVCGKCVGESVSNTILADD